MTSTLGRAVGTCIIFVGCSIAVLCVVSHPTADASNLRARDRGANIFHTKGCERCHSITGVGGDRAPDLGSVGKRRGPRQIKTQILKGGHGMPPFEDVLTKREVKDLVTFLTSCKSDQAPGCRQWTSSPSPQ